MSYSISAMDVEIQPVESITTDGVNELEASTQINWGSLDCTNLHLSSDLSSPRDSIPENESGRPVRPAESAPGDRRRGC